MLTDERIDELVRIKCPALFKSNILYLEAFHAIEAEVLQAQEPVAEVVKFGIYRTMAGLFMPVGTKLYAAQQPPAPCPKCDDFEQCSTMLNNAEREIEALQAKVAEQSAEIERLNSAYEAIDEQRNRDFETIAQHAELIEKCRLALKAQPGKFSVRWKDGIDIDVPNYETELAQKALAAIAAQKGGA